MKKATIIFISLLLLASCSPNSETRNKPLVIASFYAMYDFATSIVGDKAEVMLLIPEGSEPHSWEPTAKDMAALSEADLFVCSGAGMEPFAQSLIDSVNNEKLVYLETSAGITMLQGDPHVWLDPNNAIIQHENICSAMTGIDPDNEAYYRENLETVRQEIEALHLAFLITVDQLSSKDLVVSHAAFGYLCNAYGLNQIPVSGLSAEGEPSISQMSEIISFIKDTGTRAIFTEELLSTKVAESIAQDTGVEIYTLTPFESGDTDYVTAMRQNLDNLKKALG